MIADRIHRHLDRIAAEAEARGIAEGEARGETNGQVRTILTLIQEGDLSRERGLVRLQHLHDQRVISDDVWAEIQRRLQT